MDRFSSFIESHGQPLLDLSLYVSSSNYISVTRPTYNTILSPPLPYLIPPSLRSAAKLRTSHLGLDGLDIDTEPENSDQPSIIPQSLRNPKQSVSALLQSSPETKARIRLDALAQNFFEPLQDLLGEKRYLVSGQQFSSLDCLALGYLSLMLIPELPQPWLSKTMRAKFPGLVAWTLELRPEIYGSPVSVEDAFLSQPKHLPPNEETRQKGSKKRFLPWKVPDNRSVAGVGTVFVKTVADSIPVFGQWRRNTRMREHGGKTQDEVQSSSWQTLTLVSSLLAGAGLVVGYLFQQGLVSIGGEEKVEKEERRGLDAFGDAGAALGVYASAMDAQVQREIDMERMDGNNLHGIPVLEDDVVSEGVRKNESVR
jgi:sorting and assembly machinery component 37